MARPHLLRPASTRKRLWQLTTMLAVATLVFAIANAWQSEDRAVGRKMLGHDFLAFYTAGSFVRDGRSADLYDLEKVATYEKQVADAAGLDITVDYAARKFGPYWNPPLYAWVFAPLAALPFAQALAIWTALNLAALGGAIAFMIRMLAPTWLLSDAAGRPVDWRTTGLIPFALLLSMPFVQAISHGQNTCGSLLLLAATATFWRNRRAVLAGFCCGLMAYKPQLSAVVAVAMAIGLGGRAIAGLVLAVSAGVLLTQLTLPGVLVDYLHRMPANLKYMQIEHAYLWERHVTLAGFWRLLLQGRGAGEWLMLTRGLHAATLLVVGGLLLRALWSQRRVGGVDEAWSHSTRRTWRDRLIAATVCAAPLLMPFYFDYDLLLLAVPATMLAAEQLVRPIDPQPGDRWLVRSWVALYAWMLINPGIAGLTRVNLTVVLLAAVSVQMTRRATRPGLPGRRREPAPQPVAVARAA